MVGLLQDSVVEGAGRVGIDSIRAEERDKRVCDLGKIWSRRERFYLGQR